MSVSILSTKVKKQKINIVSCIKILFEIVYPCARVVESVDTTDLKSVALWACQFESGRGHHFFTESSLLIILIITASKAQVPMNRRREKDAKPHEQRNHGRPSIGHKR